MFENYDEWRLTPEDELEDIRIINEHIQEQRNEQELERLLDVRSESHSN